MIKGRRISLRPVTLDERQIVYDWCYHSDVAHLLHLPEERHRSFEQWCESWKDCYFVDEYPELGRVYFIECDEQAIGAIAYNDIDEKNRVELDIWMSAEANCGKGYGTEAIELLCHYLHDEMGVDTIMMQPSAGNPRAVRAYEKTGFVQVPASPREIEAEWGGVDFEDSVLMIRKM